MSLSWHTHPGSPLRTEMNRLTVWRQESRMERSRVYEFHSLLTRSQHRDTATHSPITTIPPVVGRRVFRQFSRRTAHTPITIASDHGRESRVDFTAGRKWPEYARGRDRSASGSRFLQPPTHREAAVSDRDPTESVSSQPANNRWSTVSAHVYGDRPAWQVQITPPSIHSLSPGIGTIQNPHRGEALSVRKLIRSATVGATPAASIPSARKRSPSTPARRRDTSQVPTSSCPPSDARDAQAVAVVWDANGTAIIGRVRPTTLCD